MDISTLWFIDFLRYTVDVGILCLLFSSGYKKRRSFTLSSLSLVAISVLLSVSGKLLYDTSVGKELRWMCYLILGLGLLVWLRTAYHETWWDAFFVLTSSMMTKQAAWKLYNIFLLLISESGSGFWIRIFTRGMPMWYIGWYLVFLCPSSTSIIGSPAVPAGSPSSL